MNLRLPLPTVVLTVLAAMAGGALATPSGAAPYGNDIVRTPGPELRTASTHPMKYWLVASPSREAPAGGHPVVVVITDATREFENAARSFVRARGLSDCVIVVPVTLGSGGQAQRVKEAFPYDAATWARADKDGTCAFDDDGIGAILADVRRVAHTEARATLTGLEAAGHVIFAQAFHHPERWRAVYVVTPNYQARCLDDDAAFSRDPSRTHLPIVILHGDRDTVWTKYGIFRQGDAAHAAATAHGFLNWQDRAIPARGHEFLPDVVFAAMRADSMR